MDDFVISNLHESRNEWCSRLVSIFTPLVTEGIRSIFNESWKICMNNDEANKYIQHYLPRGLIRPLNFSRLKSAKNVSSRHSILII